MRLAPQPARHMESLRVALSSGSPCAECSWHKRALPRGGGGIAGVGSTFYCCRRQMFSAFSGFDACSIRSGARDSSLPQLCRPATISDEKCFWSFRCTVLILRADRRKTTMYRLHVQSSDFQCLQRSLMLAASAAHVHRCLQCPQCSRLFPSAALQ